MATSVADGKDGTGKTTVATNLPLSIESDVLLLDCPDKASTETDRELEIIFAHPACRERHNGFLLNYRISKMLNYA